MLSVQLIRSIKNIINIVWVFILELIGRIFLIFLWNWIISEQLNLIIFGTKTLDVFKGVILTFVIQFFFITKNKLFNNIDTKTEE